MLSELDENTGQILKAIQFSAEKHRNQRRKDEIGSPYINHPINVTHFLWQTGGVRDCVTLVAALLHDTLEDTQTTPAEIEELFGLEVLNVVQEVTDDKSLPKEVRKQLQIEHAPHLSTRAKLVKLGDKSCNLNDLLFTPPHNWTEERKKQYLVWTEAVVEGLRGTNTALENAYDEIRDSGKKILEIT